MNKAERALKKISTLLEEYKDAVSGDSKTLDRFALLCMTLDYKEDNIELSVVADRGDFKVLIYHLLKANKEYANDIMVVLEDYKKETYN